MSESANLVARADEEKGNLKRTRVLSINSRSLRIPSAYKTMTRKLSYQPSQISSSPHTAKEYDMSKETNKPGGPTRSSALSKIASKSAPNINTLLTPNEFVTRDRSGYNLPLKTPDSPGGSTLASYFGPSPGNNSVYAESGARRGRIGQRDHSHKRAASERTSSTFIGSTRGFFASSFSRSTTPARSPNGSSPSSQSETNSPTDRHQYSTAAADISKVPLPSPKIKASGELEKPKMMWKGLLTRPSKPRRNHQDKNGPEVVAKDSPRELSLSSPKRVPEMITTSISVTSQCSQELVVAPGGQEAGVTSSTANGATTFLGISMIMQIMWGWAGAGLYSSDLLGTRRVVVHSILIFWMIYVSWVILENALNKFLVSGSHKKPRVPIAVHQTHRVRQDFVLGTLRE